MVNYKNHKGFEPLVLMDLKKHNFQIVINYIKTFRTSH